MSTHYSDRDYDRSYDRDEDRYGRRYDYGGSYGELPRRELGSYFAGRESDNDHYGRKGYYGRRYSSRYGSDYEYDRDRERAHYSEPYSRYSERYNYPSGYRSGETSGSRWGRGYTDDRERDEREYGRPGGEERGWWDRSTDEVRSWFGDEEAERRRRVDELREGQYRGRGPRGYRRSDDRIREDINDRLTDDPYIDAYEVEVGVSNGEVTLTGTVESRIAKRRAEDIAESVSGVANVQNNLRVSQQSATRTASATATTGTTGAGSSGSKTT